MAEHLPVGARRADEARAVAAGRLRQRSPRWGRRLSMRVLPRVAAGLDARGRRAGPTPSSARSVLRRAPRCSAPERRGALRASERAGAARGPGARARSRRPAKPCASRNATTSSAVSPAPRMSSRLFRGKGGERALVPRVDDAGVVRERARAEPRRDARSRAPRPRRAGRRRRRGRLEPSSTRTAWPRTSADLALARRGWPRRSARRRTRRSPRAGETRLASRSRTPSARSRRARPGRGSSSPRGRSAGRRGCRRRTRRRARATARARRARRGGPDPIGGGGASRRPPPTGRRRR